MKKLTKLLTAIIITLSCIAIPITAQAKTTNTTDTNTTVSPTSATESVGEKLNSQINQLKEKIASRVAELNLVEKRGLIGTVTDSTNNQITLTDLGGNTRFIDVDEITKFSSPSAKTSFGISDLTKGSQISILGLYNKQSKRILARFISIVVNPIYINGSISDVDKKNFTLTITTEDNKQQKIDIETVTKIQTYDKDNGITKYGFSKLAIGDRAFILGYPEKSDKTMLLGNRILIIPGLPKDPKVVIQEPTATQPSGSQDITPSTGSGKKLTPIKPSKK